MNKIWLDLEVRGNILDSYELNSARLMSFSGLNLGNLVFRRALEHITPMDEMFATNYTGAQKRAGSSSPSLAVVSAANWLGTDPQSEASNGVRARVMDGLKCPLVTFGLGVQWKGGGRPQFGPNTVGLARLLSERSASLSVRDSLTAEILSDYGVSNCIVTGCPSNFLNLDGALGRRLEEGSMLLPLDQRGSLRLHITEYSGGDTLSGAIIGAQTELLRDTGSFYVLQAPVMVPFVLRETRKLPDEYVRNAPKSMRDVEQLTDLYRQRTLHFASVDAWMDFARTCDFSVGMRIHGAMIALQAGVPALLIAHDSRTNGLARTMGIPFVSPEEFLALHRAGFQGVQSILGEAYRRYDEKRQSLASAMLGHLRSNGLAPTPRFADFTAERIS